MLSHSVHNCCYECYIEIISCVLIAYYRFDAAQRCLEANRCKSKDASNNENSKVSAKHGFLGFTPGKLRPDTHSVRVNEETAYGDLQVDVIKPGKSGELVTV